MLSWARKGPTLENDCDVNEVYLVVNTQLIVA